MSRNRYPLRRVVAVLSLAALAGCTGMNTTQSGAIGVNRTQYMSSMVPSQALEQEANQQYADILKQAQAKNLLD
ncbi:hypothetical protein J8998_24490, partial [Escherichia coli]